MECVISLTDDIREKLYQKIRNEKMIIRNCQKQNSY